MMCEDVFLYVAFTTWLLIGALVMTKKTLASKMLQKLHKQFLKLFSLPKQRTLYIRIKIT